MKRLATALVVSALGGSLLLTANAGATTRAAAAAPTITLVSITPFPTVTKDRPITVTTTITSDGANVALEVRQQDQPTVKKNLTVTHDGQTWTFRATFWPGDAGTWEVTATATAADNTTSRLDTQIHVWRATRIVGFSVHPQVAVKGHQVNFSGRLQVRVHGHWRGLANRKVFILLKPVGAVTSGTTDAHGRFSAYVTADQSGWYSASYPHDLQTDNAVTMMRFVKVIKLPHRHY